jgi:hypothetical protein
LTAVERGLSGERQFSRRATEQADLLVGGGQSARELIAVAEHAVIVAEYRRGRQRQRWVGRMSPGDDPSGS